MSVNYKVLINSIKKLIPDLVPIATVLKMPTYSFELRRNIG